jgi:acetolactate decarboxylase
LALGTRDGGRATNAVGDEGAALLVTATVERWQRVAITGDIAFADLDARIEELARAAGVDVARPFPFLVEGELADVTWHVLVGPPDKPGSHDHARNAVTGERAVMRGTAVGFFSTKHEGVFTHMGQHVHAHVVDPAAALAAHADRLSIRAGSVLALPAR